MKSRADLTVLVLIAVVAAGLVLAGLAKLQDRIRIVECRGKLRLIHRLLAGYASQHEDRFPKP